MALYSANSSDRRVGSSLSKTAAMYCGSNFLSTFRSMLLKMKTASVEKPLLVRMGGAPERARAWYARKMNPNVSIRNTF